MTVTFHDSFHELLTPLGYELHVAIMHYLFVYRVSDSISLYDKSRKMVSV